MEDLDGHQIAQVVWMDAIVTEFQQMAKWSTMT